MDVIYHRCCGLDVNKKTIAACVLLSEACGRREVCTLVPSAPARSVLHGSFVTRGTHPRPARPDPLSRDYYRGIGVA
jgi:hypothetical protein